MSRPSVNRDFLDIVKALNGARVEYLVVGAHAMAVHGVPRATGDFDVWIRPGRDNGERVLNALREFGAPVSDHGLTIEDLERPDTVYQMGLPPRRIDLMTGISGIGFEDAWESKVIAEFEGILIPVIGRSSLIKNKRAAGRTKDLVDLEILDNDREPE